MERSERQPDGCATGEKASQETEQANDERGRRTWLTLQVGVCAWQAQGGNGSVCWAAVGQATRGRWAQRETRWRGPPKQFSGRIVLFGRLLVPGGFWRVFLGRKPRWQSAGGGDAHRWAFHQRRGAMVTAYGSAALPTEQFVWLQRRAALWAIAAAANANGLDFQVGGGVKGFFATLLTNTMRVNHRRTTMRAKHAFLTFWTFMAFIVHNAKDGPEVARFLMCFSCSRCCKRCALM